jgi:hypothetical protein
MENTKALPVSVFVLALQIFRNYRAAWAQWEESAAEYAAEGYKPHRCFHGTNLWTDYDNICQGCEDYGFYFHDKTYAEVALDEAKARYRTSKERQDLIMKLMYDNAPTEHVVGLFEWAAEPMKL